MYQRDYQSKTYMLRQHASSRPNHQRSCIKPRCSLGCEDLELVASSK